MVRSRASLAVDCVRNDMLLVTDYSLQSFGNNMSTRLSLLVRLGTFQTLLGNRAK